MSNSAINSSFHLCRAMQQTLAIDRLAVELSPSNEIGVSFICVSAMKIYIVFHQSEMWARYEAQLKRFINLCTYSPYKWRLQIMWLYSTELLIIHSKIELQALHSP